MLKGLRWDGKTWGRVGRRCSSASHWTWQNRHLLQDWCRWGVGSGRCGKLHKHLLYISPPKMNLYRQDLSKPLLPVQTHPPGGKASVWHSPSTGRGLNTDTLSLECHTAWTALRFHFSTHFWLDYLCKRVMQLISEKQKLHVNTNRTQRGNTSKAWFHGKRNR